MRSEEVRIFNTDELIDIYRISLRSQGPATISLRFENLVKIPIRAPLERYGYTASDPSGDIRVILWVKGILGRALIDLVKI